MRTENFYTVEYNGIYTVTLENIDLKTLSLDECWDLVLEKWEYIVQLLKAGLDVADGVCDSCVFCRLHRTTTGSCGDCPIAQAGYAFCTNVEYAMWSNPTFGNALTELEFLRRVRVDDECLRRLQDDRLPENGPDPERRVRDWCHSRYQ